MSVADRFLVEAIALARENVRTGGRPFGAVVVKDDEIIARGVNAIDAANDPTAHAELLAVREAGRVLQTAVLDGCVVYASGHPCPMCLTAMRLAGVRKVAYAYSDEDGEPYGLSTARLYADLRRPVREQDISVVHRPVRPADEDDLYAVWWAVSGWKT